VTETTGHKSGPASVEVVETNRKETHHVHDTSATLVSRDPPRQADAPPAVRDRLPRLRRRVDHQCRPAVHPAVAALLGRRPHVDPERLPAHVRRIHAARGTACRPARSSPRARQRDRHHRRILARGRIRAERRRARRRPPRARAGCRAHAPDRPLHPDDEVRRGEGPEHGARCLGRDRRARVRRRCADRRRADRGPGLALGDVRQSDRMRTSARAGLPARRRRARTPPAGELRRRRLGARHRRDASARLRARSRSARRLG